MSSIKFSLHLQDNVLELNDVEEFLTKMFKDKGAAKIVLEPEEKTLKVRVYDELGNKIKEALCPPNIKEGTVLGYYFASKNLCLLPLKDRTFVLKKGCKHKKTIRPLFTLQKMRKEREKWKSS